MVDAHALGSYEDMPLEEALKATSPLHLADIMPRVSYTIYHCGKDTAVNIDAHTRKLCEAMSDYDVEFYEVPGRDHCDLTEEMGKKYMECICRTFGEGLAVR